MIKTQHDVKKVLAHCADTGMACHRCSYENRCLMVVRGKPIMRDALALIQQFEAANAEKDKRIAELEQELAAVKRERDAAVDDLKRAAASGTVCIGCIHMGSTGSEEVNQMCQQNDFNCLNCHPGCVCKACRNNSLWQWRGVCPDTEVQDGK